MCEGHSLGTGNTTSPGSDSAAIEQDSDPEIAAALDPEELAELQQALF